MYKKKFTFLGENIDLNFKNLTLKLVWKTVGFNGKRSNVLLVSLLTSCLDLNIALNTTISFIYFRSEQDSYTTHSERSFSRDKEQRKYFSSGQNNPDVEELIRAGYFMPEYKHWMRTKRGDVIRPRRLWYIYKV